MRLLWTGLRVIPEADARRGDDPRTSDANVEDAEPVELSGVGDPVSVAHALAGAVGVDEEPGRALVDTLIDELRVWQGLVVLDNREHVVAACATLVGELLGSCRHLTVLATSREPLAIDGETTREVPPLRVPDPQMRSADAMVAADVLRRVRARPRTRPARCRLGPADGSSRLGSCCSSGAGRR